MGVVRSAATAPPIAAAPGRLTLPPLFPLIGTPGAAYLEGRGIPADVARAARVRWAPDWYGRPAVVCPLYRAAELVAAQGRYTDGRNDPKARTIGPMSGGLFVTAGALEAAALVVTEAPIDALSLAAAELPAVALCGTTLRPWLVQACAGRLVLLAFDADEAGDKAYQEWQTALRAAGARVYRLRPAGAKDWNDLLQTIGPDVLRAALERQVTPRLQPWTAPRPGRPCIEPGCSADAGAACYCPAHDPFG